MDSGLVTLRSLSVRRGPGRTRRSGDCGVTPVRAPDDSRPEPAVRTTPLNLRSGRGDVHRPPLCRPVGARAEGRGAREELGVPDGGYGSRRHWSRRSFPSTRSVTLPRVGPRGAGVNGMVRPHTSSSSTNPPVPTTPTSPSGRRVTTATGASPASTSVGTVGSTPSTAGDPPSRQVTSTSVSDTPASRVRAVSDPRLSLGAWGRGPRRPASGSRNIHVRCGARHVSDLCSFFPSGYAPPPAHGRCP